MAIILFGGSFDPIHNGHLSMAQAALSFLPDAQLWLIPAACSPFKTSQRVTAENHRLAMCRLATQNQPRIAVTDVEFTLPKPSYTVHTVAHLQKEHPDAYYFLCGADAFLSLAQWKDYEQLFKMVTFLVADRQGANEGALDAQKEWVEQKGGRVQFLPMEKVPLSSTIVRAALTKTPRDTCGVPQAVAEYIRQNKLYQE